MKKTICNYLKKNLSLKDYANLVETWEVHRCADGAENVFDLNDYSEFYLFANLYGLDKALSCQKKNRFWFGGSNYTTSCTATPHNGPIEFPSDVFSAIKFIKNSIEERYLLEREDLYSKYYDYEEYHKNFYLPNTEASHALEYPVVLQHFTILFYDNIMVKTDYLKDEYCYDDILDAVANLAYAFTELYKNTEWKTTFKDYALHYIIHNFDAYFEEMYEHREYMLSAKNMFKKYSEYYN